MRKSITNFKALKEHPFSKAEELVKDYIGFKSLQIRTRSRGILSTFQMSIVTEDAKKTVETMLLQISSDS